MMDPNEDRGEIERGETEQVAARNSYEDSFLLFLGKERERNSMKRMFM